MCEIWEDTFEIAHKIWTYNTQNMHFSNRHFLCDLRFLNCDILNLTQ